MTDFLNHCIGAAIAGGEKIADYSARKVVTKNDKYVGHHAIVTAADYMSQAAILKELRGENTLFMTEEHVKDKNFKERLIQADSLERMRDSGVYIIDELDGSSSFNIGHYEWSISVGYVENLEHKAGAVFAPKIDSGLVFYASLGEGAFLENRKGKKKIEVAHRELKDSYLIFGVDCFLTKYKKHNATVHELSDLCRTTNSNGSCALPLGLVAAGKADALIQPLVCPWDWAAGKLIVEEAGGKVIFYEMEGEEINRLDRLEVRHYHPDKRAVGFVAAHENLAEEIFGRLVKQM